MKKAFILIMLLFTACTAKKQFPPSKLPEKILQETAWEEMLDNAFQRKFHENVILAKRLSSFTNPNLSPEVNERDLQKAALGTKGLVTGSAEIELEFDRNAAFVATSLKTAIENSKDGIIYYDESSEAGYVLCGSIAAGTMGLNPAIIIAYLTNTQDGCKVILRAVGKEGIIYQGTAESALDKIKTSLQAMP